MAYNMAQPISVPQNVPNAPQFQIPTDLVNGYLNRQQNQQGMFLNQIGNLGDAVNEMRQQKIQNQLNALAAYSSIAKAVGPDAANQVAGQIPNMPNWSTPQPQTTQNPDQTGQPTQTPSNPSPVPVSGSNVGPSGGSPAVPATPQPQGSPFIAASLAQGHPDYTGLLTKIQGQMAGLQNKGDRGREQQQGLGQQAQVVGQLMNNQREADQFSQNQTREASQFATSQANEQGKARAGVAEKVAPTLTASSQLEGVYNQLQKINADPNNKSIPFTGNLGAKYANAVPSTTSKWALNQKAAENQADVGAGAIEKLVEGRYNDQQMARIKSSMFPTGNELGTPVAQQKLAFFQQYLQQMKAGAVGQADAALNSIAGGSFSPSALAQPIGSQASTPTDTQVPGGRVTVVSPTGQVGHIPQAQLQAALAKGYKQQ